MTLLFSGNGIMSVSTPGVTACNAFQSQPAAFQRAVFFYRFDGIGAAGRGVPAGIRKQGRNSPLVNLYRQYEKKRYGPIQVPHADAKRSKATLILISSSLKVVIPEAV